MKLFTASLFVSILGCGANVVFGEDGSGNGGNGTGAQSSTGAGQSSGANTNSGASTNTSDDGISDDGVPRGGASPVGPGSGGSSSTGPIVSPIECGAELCDPNTEFCCAGFNQQQCLSLGQDCQGAMLSCTQATNCAPGLICCAHFEDGGPPKSSCDPDCGTGPGSGSVQLCASDRECLDGHCDEAPGGFQVCQGGNGPPDGPPGEPG